MEPPEARFGFGSLWFIVRRRDAPGWNEGEEIYDVTVTGAGGARYPSVVSVKESEKFRGAGMLQAALDALGDLHVVKTEFGFYRTLMRDLTGSRSEGDKLSREARAAAERFPLAEVDRAADLVAAEMRKIPSVQRKIRRGWEDLMRRRGMQ